MQFLGDGENILLMILPTDLTNWILTFIFMVVDKTETLELEPTQNIGYTLHSQPLDWCQV